MENEKPTRTKVSKEGFTWNSFLGLLFAGVVIYPVILWLSLVAGLAVIGIVAPIVTLLLTEIGRIYRRPLTKQETFVIWTQAPIAAGPNGLILFNDAMFMFLLYQAYTRASPLASSLGLTLKIPDWYAPPPGSYIVGPGMFFNKVWLMPALIYVFWSITFKIADMALSMFMYHLYVRQEKLEFPLAQISAEAALTLSERDETKMHIFAVSGLLSFIYAFILYGVPILTLPTFGTSMYILPIPWVDYNYLIEMFMPGASFGIATDLIIYATGFVLPFKAVVGIFIGSVAVFFFGNYFLVKENIWSGYMPGMNISDILTWSQLSFWASPVIGISIAASLLPLIRHPKFLVTVFKFAFPSKRKVRGREWIYLPIFIAATLADALVIHMLVPNFPIWIIILLSTGWSFLYANIATRSLGTTGMSINVPYVVEGAYIASGYTGVDIWFAPLIVVNCGGGQVVQNFKVCDMLETKISSWIKGYFVAAAISSIMSLVYLDFFLRMAPIPSSMYPATQIYWPVNLIYRFLWITRSIKIFNPTTILGGFGVIAILFVIFELIGFDFPIVSLAAGCTTPIPIAISTLMGAIVGLFFKWKFGEGWWNRYRAVVVAGIGAGEGISVGIATGIAVILKSLWGSAY